jgi:uncharacterized protein (TIGR03437 family)
MQKRKLLAGSFLTALFFFPAFCQAQTISIVSGNGQLVCPDCPGAPGKFAPLVAQVNNAAGQPVANTTVTWTATQTGVATTPATSLTNASGQASYDFQGAAFFFESNFLPATVVASALSTSVTFVETSTEPVLSGPGGGSPPVTISLVPAASAPVLTGTTGQTATTPISVQIYGSFAPLSGIQVSLVPWIGSISTGSPGELPWPANAPSVTCATQAGQEAGTVLTDATGTATCTPVFGGTLGSGTYTIVIGNAYKNFGPTGFTVAAGAPALMKLISGNNQSVNPGAEAISALEVEITDIGGNPSVGAAVTWAVTAGSATLINPTTSSNTQGEVSAYVKPTVGPVNVTVSLVSNSSVKYVFTVNVNTVITALQAVSGGGQQAKESVAFADPLIVQVNDNTTPVAGATVNFTVTSGSATLSAASAITGANGQAQVTVTAGATAGPVVVTATVPSSSTISAQTFDLTVIPPGPVITAVVNAAGFQNQFVSPCSLATIYGSAIAPALQGVASAMIAPQTQVAGVTVQFGGVSAPILDVANVNGQETVSVQVPCEVPSSAATPAATVQMVVTADGAASAPFNVTVLPLSPGIFQFTDTDGQVRAVLVRQDGTFINIANPARPGDTLRMFVTGLGQTTPPLFTNEFDPLVEVNNSWVPQSLPVNTGVVVGINNGGALVLSAQYAYGMVGVYEVDFQVPENTASGNNAPFAIVLFQGTSVVFGNGSLIPIQ